MTNLAATKKSELSAQETQIVNAWLSDPELSPASVAQRLSMDVATVLSVLRRESVRRAMALGLLTEKNDRLKEVRDGVVLSLWQMATYDLADLFDEEGTPRHIQAMPPAMRSAIKGYKMGKYGPEFTFVDKSAILLSMLQHLSKVEQQKSEDKEEGVSVIFYDSDAEGEEV